MAHNKSIARSRYSGSTNKHIRRYEHRHVNRGSSLQRATAPTVIYRNTTSRRTNISVANSVRNTRSTSQAKGEPSRLPVRSQKRSLLKPNSINLSMGTTRNTMLLKRPKIGNNQNSHRLLTQRPPTPHQPTSQSTQVQLHETQVAPTHTLSFRNTRSISHRIDSINHADRTRANTASLTGILGRLHLVTIITLRSRNAKYTQRRSRHHGDRLRSLRGLNRISPLFIRQTATYQVGTS